MADKFPNWMNINIQETQGTASIRKSKRPTLRHIIINYHRIIKSQRILKAAREKQITTYKGSSLRFSAHFSLETVEARRQKANIFKVFKGKKKCQPWILHLAKGSFKSEEIKTFPDEQKLRELVTTRAVLQEMPRGVLPGEMNGYW